MKSEQLLRSPQLSEIFQWSSHTKHFKPQHQYAYSPLCSSYISHGTEEETLFHNRQLLQQVIISFILATVMCDPGVILQGEVRCQSLHWVQGLSEKETEKHSCVNSDLLVVHVLTKSVILLKSCYRKTAQVKFPRSVLR